MTKIDVSWLMMSHGSDYNPTCMLKIALKEHFESELLLTCFALRHLYILHFIFRFILESQVVR